MRQLALEAIDDPNVSELSPLSVECINVLLQEVLSTPICTVTHIPKSNRLKLSQILSNELHHAIVVEMFGVLFVFSCCLSLSSDSVPEVVENIGFSVSHEINIRLSLWCEGKIFSPLGRSFGQYQSTLGIF